MEKEFCKYCGICRLQDNGKVVTIATELNYRCIDTRDTHEWVTDIEETFPPKI